MLPIQLTILQSKECNCLRRMQRTNIQIYCDWVVIWSKLSLVGLLISDLPIVLSFVINCCGNACWQMMFKKSTAYYVLSAMSCAGQTPTLRYRNLFWLIIFGHFVYLCCLWTIFYDYIWTSLTELVRRNSNLEKQMLWFVLKLCFNSNLRTWNMYIHKSFNQ